MQDACPDRIRGLIDAGQGVPQQFHGSFRLAGVVGRVGGRPSQLHRVGIARLAPDPGLQVDRSIVLTKCRAVGVDGLGRLGCRDGRPKRLKRAVRGKPVVSQLPGGACRARVREFRPGHQDRGVTLMEHPSLGREQAESERGIGRGGHAPGAGLQSTERHRHEIES